MVDVQQALAAIEALPEADKEVPVFLQQASAPAEEIFLRLHLGFFSAIIWRQD